MGTSNTGTEQQLAQARETLAKLRDETSRMQALADEMERRINEAAAAWDEANEPDRFDMAS